MPLTLFATISPKPEYFSQARRAIRAILDRTRAENGCQTFDIYEDLKSGRLCLFEVWDDEQALNAHHAEPYTQDVFRQYDEWLAAPVSIVTLQPVER